MTSVTSIFFKQIAISNDSKAKEKFIDGKLRYNNPIIQVLEKARDVFGND